MRLSPAERALEIEAIEIWLSENQPQICPPAICAPSLHAPRLYGEALEQMRLYHAERERLRHNKANWRARRFTQLPSDRRSDAARVREQAKRGATPF